MSSVYKLFLLNIHHLTHCSNTGTFSQLIWDPQTPFALLFKPITNSGVFFFQGKYLADCNKNNNFQDGGHNSTYSTLTRQLERIFMVAKYKYNLTGYHQVKHISNGKLYFLYINHLPLLYFDQLNFNHGVH